ncbi:SDR family oxidoreductase [Actinobacteria bacterium YIM 96077]|uniref:SDR family NAD(P)-dependent oxidoreductase n=1 Tax=Phytoactinopolyspora halophila TaxID=1981511 RepID=A0A329QTQ7_9ACTN|nr:SDR family NAD(P)-dependent oxidoreductase [Phytoactinopolyspora halophila]AYY14949.1 SDR family oxidoreductase [Actinobacteria bacterium YIM 96077]RAW15406.1 SDR family NAD(P)-dependent oxidoreductase [Phytoactinopolyspora halophila]
MEIATGRKALITGGASGFGREIARRLHESGAQVAILDINEQHVRDTAKELGPDVLGFTADVRNVVDTENAVRQCSAELGGLDTLVIAAGVFHMGPSADISETDWDRVVDVNLKGAFFTAQAALTDLRQSQRGRIVAIGSDAGRRGFPGLLPYTASKFGLVGVTEALAAEFAADAVTVNCVCPVGCPTTGMGQEVVRQKTADGTQSSDDIIRAAAQTNPLGRNATETDVTDAVLFFISDSASFLTGVSLDVDGGAHLGATPGVN